MSKNNEQERIFWNHYNEYYKLKPNKRPWNTKLLNEIANEIRVGKTSKRKTRRQYFLLSTYDTVTINDKISVIRKIKRRNDPLICIVPEEEIYDRLSEIHVGSGHGSRDKMISIIQQNSVIPRPCVEMLLKSCQSCRRKKSKNIISKIIDEPIIQKGGFMTRGQVDLIDFQATPDGDYKWLLNYQDHSTKYTCLRPLRTRQINEIATELLKIFLQFGAPAILQSDSSREFLHEITQELKRQWPQLLVVHGKSYRLQNQSCVNPNYDVEKMIRAWKVENNSTSWSIGCYYVQWQKNNYMYGIDGHCPHKAVFGSESKLGLQSTSLPSHIIATISTEEELGKTKHEFKTTFERNEDKIEEIEVGDHYDEINKVQFLEVILDEFE